MKGTLNMNISNMNNIESRVQSYWTKRAHNFNIVRKNELNSSISERWREEIVHFLPEGKVLQILDVGTGTGYFAILLSQSGHQVTGIDLTDAMLKEARDNAALYQVHPTFQQMDAQKLAFWDQSFDVVISRNLTWTLPDPESAYREWMRVLKKGGTFAIHDLMSPGRYGDMQAFVQKLRDMGYERVELIDTTDGSFMTPKEAKRLMLRGSTLLVGRK